MDQASQGNPEPTAAPFVPPVRFAWTPWLTAICGTFLIFAILTWLVLVPVGVRDFDLSCALAMKEHAHTHPAVRHFFWLITWSGGIVALTLLATAGTLTMFFRKEYLLAGIWVLATAGGALVNLGFKHTVSRVRPVSEIRDESVAGIRNPSYPSGHAMGSAIGFGMWIIVLMRFTKWRWAKALALAGLIVQILLIGFSRIYLRAHWATDVLSGFALGTSWLLVCLTLEARVRARAPSAGR